MHGGPEARQSGLVNTAICSCVLRACLCNDAAFCRGKKKEDGGEEEAVGVTSLTAQASGSCGPYLLGAGHVHRGAVGDGDSDNFADKGR